MFVSRRLLSSDSDVRQARPDYERAGLLDLYAQLRAGRRVADDDANPLITLLRLSGLANVSNNRLQARNRIYHNVFDKAWITANMPDAELRRQRTAYRAGLLRAAAIAAVILALVGGLAAVAFQQRNRAQTEARRADEKTKELEQKTNELEIALADAKSQRKRAEDKQSEADGQRSKAEEQKELAEKKNQEAQAQKRAADEQRAVAEENNQEAQTQKRTADAQRAVAVTQTEIAQQQTRRANEQTLIAQNLKEEAIRRSEESNQSNLQFLGEMVQRQPDSRACIIYYGGCGDEGQKLAQRQQNYLINTLHLDASRVVFIDGGCRETTAFENYLVPLGVALPRASGGSPCQPCKNLKKKR